MVKTAVPNTTTVEEPRLGAVFALSRPVVSQLHRDSGSPSVGREDKQEIKGLPAWVGMINTRPGVSQRWSGGYTLDQGKTSGLPV